MEKKIKIKASEELKRLRECYQSLQHDYREAVRILGEYYHTAHDHQAYIENKYRLEKSPLLKEFVESVPKEQLPETILIVEASGGVSLPVKAGKLVVDMGIPASEAEYYVPRFHMTYKPPTIMGYGPSPEERPDRPEFIGIEKLLEKGVGGFYHIEPRGRESFEYWRDNPNKSATLEPPHPIIMDKIIQALEKHFTGTENSQKLGGLMKKFHELELRRDSETEEAERKYYPLLRQRVSNLVDVLITYSLKYRLITFVQFGECDTSFEGYKEGRRKFFLLKERKLISAPYKSFLGSKIPVPDLKNVRDLPDKQWLRFVQLLEYTLLKPFISERQLEFITTSEPWRFETD